MNILKVIHIVSVLLGLAILNHHFKEQQNKRRFKNTNPELVKYDSLITAEIDSLITTTYRK